MAEKKIRKVLMNMNKKITKIPVLKNKSMAKIQRERNIPLEIMQDDVLVIIDNDSTLHL